MTNAEQVQKGLEWDVGTGDSFISYDEGCKNDFGEIGYGGPAPPDGRHTYIFKAICILTLT